MTFVHCRELRCRHSRNLPVLACASYSECKNSNRHLRASLFSCRVKGYTWRQDCPQYTALRGCQTEANGQAQARCGFKMANACHGKASANHCQPKSRSSTKLHSPLNHLRPSRG